MKLKYLGNHKMSYDYVRINGRKKTINVTVDFNDKIDVDNEVGEALISTGNFKKITTKTLPENNILKGEE